ncbi:MAG: TonB family protein [Endomicrobium sp.]|jgi:TonB family protein|nr:TonB family protein [Endomicrobium sp.]
MRLWPNNYETISNAASISVIIAISLLFAIASVGEKTIAVSGVMPFAVSVEYALLQADFSQASSISESDAEGILPQIKKTIQPKPQKKEKISDDMQETEKTVSDDEAQNAQYSPLPYGQSASQSDDEFLQLFLQTVQALLYYPKHAQKAGITGIVEIKVSFSDSGEIESAQLAGKNHNKILGGGAMKTMERVKNKWRPVLKPQKKQTVIIPVSFKLT